MAPPAIPNILTALQPDPPLVQSARTPFGPADRQWIDARQGAAELHLATNLLNGLIATYFKLDSGSAAVQPGDVLCATASAAGTATLATLTALANVGRPLGVVLRAASPGGFALAATAGYFVPSRLNLPASVGAARVSTAGRVERVASLVLGDVGVGAVDAAGGLTLDLQAARALGGALLPLSGFASGTGANGGAFWISAIQPSVDFPGATQCVLKATLYGDHTGGEPAWAASTGYSPGDLAGNADGGGTGIPVVYVCTTGGTSSGTHGPTGFGTGLLDQGGSACRWKSQEAVLSVVQVTSGGFSTLATTTNSMTLQGAFALTGAGLLEVTYDLSSILIGLSSPAMILVGVAGDPADTGGTSYTLGRVGNARLLFT